MKRIWMAVLSLGVASLSLWIGVSAADCDHNWVIDYTKCTAATCANDGVTAYSCSRCDGVKTERIPASGHDYVKQSGTDATCTTKGYVWEKCSVCQDEQYAVKDALGHDYKEVSRKGATCSTAGVILYECSLCDTQKTEAIPTTDHDFSKFISTSATCTEAGKATYQCSGCDALTLKTSAKLGHDYEKTDGPTCTEKGRYTNTCTRCGDSYEDTKVTKALGHDLPADGSSKWRVTKEATCEKEGSRRAKCARCDEYVTEEIPATDHEYDGELYLIKVPTKTKTGKYQVICQHCGEAETETIAKGTTNLRKYSVPPVVFSLDDDSDIVPRGTKVTLSCALDDAVIFYTTNGKSPTNEDYQIEYTGAITVTQTTKIRAYAVYEEDEDVDPTEIISLTLAVQASDPWVYLEDDASDGGYMSLTNNKFRPDDNATRYEVIEAMDELFGSWAEDADISFTDVDKKHKNMVSKFVGAKLLDGYDDKNFGGTYNIKRSELCKVVALALGLDTSKTSNVAFTDVDKKHWAYSYIAALTKAGYLKGDTDGTFRPDDPISRAELATLMNRIAGIKNAKGVTISDVSTTHWAYGYICAAVKKS